MPAPPTWPPPPTVPDPLATYDEFLTALVCAPVTKPPLSRLRLARSLHQATGMDLRQCHTVVSYFCDHHGILPQLRVWKLFLPFAVQVVITGALMVSDALLGRDMAIAPTQMARHLELREQNSIHVFFLCLMLVLMIVLMIFSLFNAMSIRRQARREAEAAREKMSQ